MPELNATKLKDRIAENRQKTQKYRDIADGFLYLMSDLDQHECPITFIEDDIIEDDSFSATKELVICKNAIVVSRDYGAFWVSEYPVTTTQEAIEQYGAYAVMYYYRKWDGGLRRDIASFLLDDPEFRTRFDRYIYVSLLTNPVYVLPEDTDFD